MARSWYGKYGANTSDLLQYIKSRKGFCTQGGTKMIDLLCSCLSQDLKPIPSGVSKKAWVIENIEYIKSEGKENKKKTRQVQTKEYRQYKPKKVKEYDSFIVEGRDVRSKEFLSTWAWRGLRYQAIKKYGAICMACGATPQSSGEPIQVDHIKPRSIFPLLAMDMDNLQILCSPCNMGKSNTDFTDWRFQEVVEELDEDQKEHMRSIAME